MAEDAKVDLVEEMENAEAASMSTSGIASNMC